jgi:hypothetical protein
VEYGCCLRSQIVNYLGNSRIHREIEQFFLLVECLMKKTEFHEIILGNIDDCKVTLVNCMRISWRKTLAGTGDSSSSEFDLIAICKGHHFVKKTDLIFNTISVRYSYIRRWLGGKRARINSHLLWIKIIKVHVNDFIA